MSGTGPCQFPKPKLSAGSPLGTKLLRRRALKLIPLALATILMGSGCSDPRNSWPPEPRNRDERELVEAARLAVRKQDGWENVLFLVERHEGAWRVQAWKVLYPNAQGRNRCSPAWVRAIHFDDRGTMTDYRNHL